MKTHETFYEVAQASLDAGDPWQEQVADLGVDPGCVETEGARCAQAFAARSVPFHDAVAAAFASGFHLGLRVALAPDEVPS